MRGCKCGWCCVRPSKTTALVGFFLSLTELILAACYNFHTFGFVLAIVGLLASIAYLIIICMGDKNRADSKELSLNGEMAEYRPVPNVEEL